LALSPGARRSVERPLGHVHVVVRDGRPQVIDVKAVRGERAHVGDDAHRQALAAAHGHEADARQLRDFLREARVGEILQIGERQGLRDEPEREDRRIGRIHLRVDRRRRKI